MIEAIVNAVAKRTLLILLAVAFAWLAIGVLMGWLFL